MKQFVIALIIVCGFQMLSAQYAGGIVGNWTIAHYVGFKEHSSIKIAQRHHSPISLDRYYTNFISHIYKITESEDSIFVYIYNSEKIMGGQILNDSNLCVCEGFEPIVLDNGSLYARCYYPLHNVHAYTGKAANNKYKKLQRIDYNEDRCVYRCQFQKDQREIVLLMYHENYELVNVLKLTRRSRS